MKIQTRIYGGKYFRPKPIIDLDESRNRVLVVTAWGQKEFADSIVNKMKEYLAAIDSEQDVTQHLECIDALSPNLNKLRSAVMMANEYLFTENRKEMKGAVEILLIQYDHGAISWVQVGSPNFFVFGKKSIQPVGIQMDLSEQFELDSPLFNQALGIDKICHVQCGSFRIPSSYSSNSENEIKNTASVQIVLISRSGFPIEFLNFKNSLNLENFESQAPITIEGLSKVLVQDSVDKPFWLGLLQV